MPKYLQITTRVDEGNKNDFFEMAHGFFVITSFLMDSEGEHIKDSNGENLEIIKEFNHFNKEKIFDYIINLKKTEGIHYTHEISYEHY